MSDAAAGGWPAHEDRTRAGGAVTPGRPGRWPRRFGRVGAVLALVVSGAAGCTVKERTDTAASDTSAEARLSTTTTARPATTATTAPPATVRAPAPTTTAPPPPPPPPPTTAAPVTTVTTAAPPPPPPPPPTTEAPGGGCHPSYQPCVPFAADVDCSGGSGNGPAYTGPVTVVGPDEYDLDSDDDGQGCE